MVKRPGRNVRGSTTGRPIMVLFDVLGQRWSMRILWELRGGPQSFRGLQSRCDGISPTVLNGRLKSLRDLKLVVHEGEGYQLSPYGEELGEQLSALDVWANRWAKRL